jgi:hypothetical protein
MSKGIAFTFGVVLVILCYALYWLLTTDFSK